MEIGIITVTPNGVELALKLAQVLPEVTIYAKAGRTPAKLEPKAVNLYSVMKDLMAEAFYGYDGLIFFTSTGIAVRMLAPYLQHKVQDPAVVVVDEQGRFAISLLSGHLGGANELTMQVANIIKAEPVITTASDRQGKLAPDALAGKLHLTVYPLEAIKTVNGAIVAGEQVNYYLDEAWANNKDLLEALAKYKVDYQLISIEALANLTKPRVVFTPQRLNLPEVLCITNKKLIAGVGCRKGVSYDLIDQAITAAKIQAKVENVPISQLTSTVVKAQEENLLGWANCHKVPINFYDNEVMGATIARFHLEESQFVKGQIGIGNVCEASILSYNPRAKIILKKSKFEKVTVSLAWE